MFCATCWRGIIFKFDDFVTGGKLDDLQKMKSNLVKEGLFSDEDHYEEDEDDDIHLQHRNLSFDEDEEINQELNPYKVPSSEIEDEDDDEEGFDDFDEDEGIDDDLDI